MQTEENVSQTGDFLQNHSILDDEAVDDELGALLASLDGGGNAAVKIYRQGPGGYRDVTLLTEWLPADFSEMRLQREFGGGHFRIHVRDGRKILKNFELKVAPPVSATPAAIDVMAPVQRQLGEMAAAISQLAQVVARAQAAPVTPPAAQSRREFFEEMMLMKQVLGGGAPRERDPLETLTKLIQVQKDISGVVGGGEGGEPGTNTLILRALETLGPILAAGRQAQPQPMMQPNPAPALPGVATSAPPAVAGQPTQEETDMLKFYLNMLIREAEQNIDPAGYALLMTQKVDRAQLLGMLEPDNWFDVLAQFEPKVTPYREWFSELRDAALEILKDEGQADITGENNPGGTNHASAGTSKAGT